VIEYSWFKFLSLLRNFFKIKLLLKFNFQHKNYTPGNKTDSVQIFLIWFDFCLSLNQEELTFNLYFEKLRRNHSWIQFFIKQIVIEYSWFKFLSFLRNYFKNKLSLNVILQHKNYLPAQKPLSNWNLFKNDLEVLLSLHFFSKCIASCFGCLPACQAVVSQNGNFCCGLAPSQNGSLVLEIELQTTPATPPFPPLPPFPHRPHLFFEMPAICIAERQT